MLNQRHRTVMLVALTLVAVLTACTGPTRTDDSLGVETELPGGTVDLDGTEWTLVSLNGKSLIDSTRITLNFADGFVNGFAGCNGYRSLIVGADQDKFKYTATDDGTLTIPNFMITEKDCPEPEGVMQQELAYVEALRNATSYKMIEGRLEIQNASGEMILVFAPQESFRADAGDLVGTEWVLTLLNNNGLVEGTNITLTFAAGQIGGFAGCNAYGGGYTATRQGTLTINEVEVTAQGCVEPDGVMQQENTYIEALTGARAFRVMEDRLEIEDAAGGATLVFTRKEEYPMDPGELVGTAWQLVSWNGDRSTADSIITLVFHDDKAIVGYAGCRGYVASYEANGDSIRFPFLGMTGSVDPCSETLLLQESEYTTSLEWVTNYRLREGQLELLTARGEILLFESLPEDAKTSLEGTTWVLTAFTEEKMVEGMSVPVLMITDLLEGTQITATFENGTISGSAGCNSYSAPYTFDGSLITYETVVTTEIGCVDPPGVMEQEQRVLNLLKGTADVRVDGNQLRIETGAGRTLVFAAGE